MGQQPAAADVEVLIRCSQGTIMRLIRTLAGACILVFLGSAIGGCVVVPHPYGYRYYHERG